MCVGVFVGVVVGLFAGYGWGWTGHEKAVNRTRRDGEWPRRL